MTLGNGAKGRDAADRVVSGCGHQVDLTSASSPRAVARKRRSSIISRFFLNYSTAAPNQGHHCKRRPDQQKGRYQNARRFGHTRISGGDHDVVDADRICNGKLCEGR
jgi:hypothetical protein